MEDFPKICLQSCQILEIFGTFHRNYLKNYYYLVKQMYRLLQYQAKMYFFSDFWLNYMHFVHILCILTPFLAL